MAKRAFFSFHYEDVSSFRANVVRNSWVTHNNGNINSFVDSSIWEDAKTKGPEAIKRLIEERGLKNTSVTALLIGEETFQRRWVKYEIVKSFDKGNGIIGIHINRIRDKTGYITSRGLNPLDRLGFEVSRDGNKISFYELENRSWYVYDDLPMINNKQSNTVFFEEDWFGNDNLGKFFTFSEFFPTYCWNFDNGYENLGEWVEDAKKITA